MNTFYILLGKYGHEVMIPSEIVARDWFNVGKAKFHEKVSRGEIALPVMSMDDSQKSPRGVHILDLAEYLDKRRNASFRK
ncbi:Pyocin activator protein PrtN [Thioclava sp. NG1]|uniref:pyocin activator PrtN family protein n=1 Tax=Thioclava sp. NG1 TaxID=2182426 RepID=UPI000D60BA0C|nr:pyocin activator PrtN family protein [Thioclava sp. NG1]PWE48514.1 Pyocin activator protein PrtN [Thioclava sp. NG1]